MPERRAGRGAATAQGRVFQDLAREVIQLLAVLMRNATLHDPNNEVFREPMSRLRELLEPVIAGEGRFDLECVGADFFANGTRIRMQIKNLHIYKYVSAQILERGLGGLRFTAAPEARSLVGLLQALALVRASDAKKPVEVFNQQLESTGAQDIEALVLRVDHDQPQGDRRQRAIQAYQQAFDFIRECMTTLQSPAQLNLRKAKRVVHKLVDLSYEQGDGFSLAGLAAIKGYDEYTFNHMVNVCVLSVAFGHRLGLSRAQLAQLGLAALYHDMGKLSIPLEVLQKHGPLSEAEWALMGDHTVFGARTLFPLIEGDPDTIRRILTALQHHVGYDRRGYPDLEIVSEPILFARIVAIVDTFDAMTSKRVYQRRFLPDESLAVIQGAAGGRYDPLLVKAFINCMGIFPVGSTVLLASGELAVVCEANPDPDRAHRPKVRLVTDPQQGPVESSVVDLAQPDQAGRQILRCVDPEEFGINAAAFAV